MSNPIKSLIPTPLSMEFISDINSLNSLPLPISKFLIDCSVSHKTSSINKNDQKLLTNILKRQKVTNQCISGSINATKQIQRIQKKVIKLMRMSAAEEVQGNLQNCQKYLGSVLMENTFLNQQRIKYLMQKLSVSVLKVLRSEGQRVQTSLGTVEWAICSLKKASLSLTPSVQKSNENRSDPQSQPESSNDLKQINKMYVKVSFDEYFPYGQIDKLVKTGFQSNSDSAIESKIQTVSISQKSNSPQKNRSKTITMSLIDFRLFMEELQKVKNINY